MRHILALLITIVFTNTTFADSNPRPQVLFDKNYVMYQTQGDHIVFDLVYAEDNWCISELKGKKATLWVLRGGIYEVTISGCDSKSKSKGYGTNRIIFGNERPKDKWKLGLVVIKPEIEEGYTGELTDDKDKEMLIEHLGGRYQVIISYPGNSSMGKDVVRIGESYGDYVNYDIECRGIYNDSDYGYYDVCDSSQVAGSYLYDVSENKSIRIKEGVPLNIYFLFKYKDEVVVYGSTQTSKSTGYDSAYLIKNESVKLIYKGIDTGS